MTDDDVAKLAAEVLVEPLDQTIDTEWRAEGLMALRRQEQRQMLEWRLARFLRDDASMTRIAADLKKTRSAIGFLATPEEPPA